MGFSENAPYVAEFVGTFMLAFVAGCVVLSKTGVWTATAIGFALTALIYALGPVSGGHFNPAVSFAAGIAGKLPWGQAALYMALQTIAAVLASALTSWMFFTPLRFPTQYDMVSAATVEGIYTFMLCFVVLSCTAVSAKSGSQYAPLAIGFVVVAGAYAVGSISGALFNPALTLGWDVTTLVDDITWRGPMYVLFQLIGAGAAALFFFTVHPEELRDRDDSTAGFGPTVISEFLGTFLLVVTVGFNIATGSSATAWSAGACLTSLVYSLGDVSGGHLNPAVSLGVLMTGRDKLSPGMCAVYWSVHLIAGIVGGLLLNFYGHASNMRSFSDIGAFPSPAALWVEVVFTFLLVFVVLAAATTRTDSRFYFALAIGMSLVAGGFSAGHISGGVLNPAVGVGSVVAAICFEDDNTCLGNELELFRNSALYAAAEFLGAVLAAVTFRGIYVREYAPTVQEALEERMAEHEHVTVTVGH